MKSLFEKRPFKIRNAEEFELNQVLSLFVHPSGELRNPFEFENSIVKGRMGTGKTMYLKANHAYYLYTLVPSIVEKAPLILPVYIRLSDFQQHREPEDVYRAVILKIIEELSSIYHYLGDARKLAVIHQGLRAWPEELSISEPIRELTKKLLKLNAEEYTETVNQSLGLTGGMHPKFFDLSAKYEEGAAVEVRAKKQPGINDVFDAYKMLLSESGGKILILLDEAGSLNKSFFKQGSETPFFEVLMNQLRTAEYIRTKIAVYPQSYSDILTETRYGDMIMLNDNVSDEAGYSNFRDKSLQLITRYLTTANDGVAVSPEQVFEVEENDGCGIEQLINASGGNMRRFTHLLDLSMTESYARDGGLSRVGIADVLSVLNKHANSMKEMYTEQDRNFLGAIAKACRARGTYKFQFPYKAPVLSKYISKSEEYNVLSISEMGGGRRGTTYAFDYAYSVNNDIPTHYLHKTEKIDKSRSRKTGGWIPRVATISEGLLKHANIPGKIEGTIGMFWTEKAYGFLTGDDGNEYFLTSTQVVDFDKDKALASGKRVRFFPGRLDDGKFALAVEVL